MKYTTTLLESLGVPDNIEYMVNAIMNKIFLNEDFMIFREYALSHQKEIFQAANSLYAPNKILSFSDVCKFQPKSLNIEVNLYTRVDDVYGSYNATLNKMIINVDMIEFLTCDSGELINTISHELLHFVQQTNKGNKITGKMLKNDIKHTSDYAINNYCFKKSTPDSADYYIRKTIYLLDPIESKAILAGSYCESLYKGDTSPIDSIVEIFRECVEKVNNLSQFEIDFNLLFINHMRINKIPPANKYKAYINKMYAKFKKQAQTLKYKFYQRKGHF